MFDVGETVLYGTEGVCRVDRVECVNMGDGPREYYVLKPVFRPGNTVFVPASSEKLTHRMRKILSAQEIQEIINGVCAEEMCWSENENERKNRYGQILESGDRRACLNMIKTLYLRKHAAGARGKKLHLCDEAFLKDAERLLCDEFGLVLGIEPDKVPAYIQNRVEKNI